MGFDNVDGRVGGQREGWRVELLDRLFCICCGK